LLPLFCVIFAKKSKGKWIKKRDFGQTPFFEKNSPLFSLFEK
jgi:hypothetical protein